MKLRLLKRINNWEQTGVVSASDADIDEVLESMRDDLEKLFNTRRGTVLIDDDFGLPDFTQLMNGYAAPDVDAIQRDMLNQVRRYEPRLAVKEMNFQQPDGRGSLKFGLNATLRHKQQDLSFIATVQIAENGSIGVSL